MTYEEVVAALQTMCEVPLNNADENFQRIIPTMFLYADGRIYRDLAFLVNEVTQPINLVARTPSFALPINVRVLRGINVCTPASTTITVDSKRTPLERIPSEMLDFIWPQSSYRPSVPKKFAIIGSMTGLQPQVMQHTVRLMPMPDQNYMAELLGEIQPLPLSTSNAQTYLSVTYPELFIAACMIFAAGYQRDFGAQADDPTRAMSWETQYNGLRLSALLEAARMRGEGAGWTAEPPAPAAQPRAP